MRAAVILGVAGLAVGLVVQHAAAQQARPRGTHQTGQEVIPAYEGWEQNSDGSFTLVFGTFNRNWREEIHIPIGPDNSIEPGGPDQGQPTYFFPRRNRFQFEIRVPADFGEREVVWTLRSPNGETKRAYGTLKPDYFIDNLVRMMNNGLQVFGEVAKNVGPELTVDGPLNRTAVVHQPVTLTAVARDKDDIPAASPERFTREGRERAERAAAAGMGGGGAPGLRVSWNVYRGPANADFDPPQLKTWEDTRRVANSPWAPGYVPPPLPEDNTWVVRSTFSEPGTYVLRCLVSDGGLTAHEDVTIVVTE